MITTTPMQIAQYDAIMTLWQQSENVGLSSADSRDSIDAYLQRNPGMSFVACDAARVVGAILGGHDGRRGYIHHLAVHQAYRRQGIGSRLVARVLDQLAAASIQKCHLFIFHENQAGEAFWRRQGWELRQDIVVMSYRLENGH